MEQTWADHIRLLEMAEMINTQRKEAKRRVWELVSRTISAFKEKK